MRTLSLIIPVFNNAPTLPELFDRILSVQEKLRALGVKLDLIFVDDNSTDGSRDLLCELVAKHNEIKLLLLTKNFGGINASKAGWSKATGEVFSTLASDLQEPPELIIEMAEEWLKGHEFILCERTSRDDRLLEKINSFLFYKLLRSLVFPDYPKGGYDLALLPRRHLPSLLYSAKSVYPAALIWSLGITPKIITYSRVARKHGKSGWTFPKKLNAVKNIIFGFTNKPMRASILLGSITSIGSFTYGTIVIVAALLDGNPVPGFATLVTLMTFLLGIVFVNLGILSEYVWLIFLELNKQPTYVIDREFNTDV